MQSLLQLAAGNTSIPAVAAWYAAELSEFRGKQQLYTRQSPQRLKALREHALIQSAVSSNRMEGVEVDPERLTQVLAAAKPLFRDRDEEEVRGYREALSLIHGASRDLEVNEETVLRLHRMTRGSIWDAGCYKDRDGDIVEHYPDGRRRVRFRTVSAAETPAQMSALVQLWARAIPECRIPALILAAAFGLDFLCIHPFRDGNGRVSRLLLLLQCYHLGYEVGRYISLERLIEQNKERYYETLEKSSQGWHEGRHDPWPYINFVLYILKIANEEFADRLGEVKAPRGSKTGLVLAAIQNRSSEFTLEQIERECPGVSRDLIRRVLAGEKGKTVDCLGRGPGARWRRKGQYP
jgi:Fic family protein